MGSFAFENLSLPSVFFVGVFVGASITAIGYMIRWAMLTQGRPGKYGGYVGWFSLDFLRRESRLRYRLRRVDYKIDEAARLYRSGLGEEDAQTLKKIVDDLNREGQSLRRELQREIISRIGGKRGAEL